MVVFAAPQLSLIEMAEVADLSPGGACTRQRRWSSPPRPRSSSPPTAWGSTARIEDAGGIVAAGVCFYQSYAREMAEANGWQRLLTNSAKLVNIIAGYGYKPTLASMARCIDSAVAGKVV